ncbi:AI-2E family transporter, partial [Sanguibacteroides justesenii]
VIIAAFISPLLLIKVLIVFAVEQTLEGRLVSPLVLGSKMAMYPVTTIIVLLASGKLFGLAGVILGIPVYAIIKILISHLFEWFKSVSGLYEQ